MKKICYVFLCLLLIWFTFDMTGLAIGNILLVEQAIKSDGFWWFIFIVAILLFIVKEKAGKYVLSIFILLWAIIQYFSHWNYTLFGVSDEKLQSYNKYFKETHQLIPSKETILVPDLYHIILHVLIVINLILLTVFVLRKNNTSTR
ncbi:hypothetical protein [Haloplasma contractile]|uniref:Uncharacterized protein n=1 Tax=Haloplasma contractile SSD-17B TaxID=1033810 RepID=U2FK48_9MOLU|nr:hypothetical protein [Haloplasma contractile]ERJ13190.1 hypothetical protein HLPCO_000809 [Haloplasma contractile SSD-17B]